MTSKSMQHKDLITIGKPTRCEGNIKRLRYGNDNSEYVICSDCKAVFFKPKDETLQARPIMKVVGRMPTKQKELPKLGRPFKRQRKRKKEEQKSE